MNTLIFKNLFGGFYPRKSRKIPFPVYLSFVCFLMMSTVQVFAQPPVINCPADITVCQDSPTGACNLTFFPQTVPSPVTIDYAERLITYTGVSINGGGNSAVVAPGTLVNLSYNLSVSFNYSTGYCPGCIVQSSIGIGSTFQTLQCEPSIGNGYGSSPSLSFNAPTTPGIYYLTQEGSLDYFCQEFKFNNSPASAIGVLIVGSPYPTASGGYIGVSVTNNAPACFPVGVTQLTWTATDSSGSTATCTQNVTVLPATVYYRDRDGDGFGNPCTLFMPAHNLRALF